VSDIGPPATDGSERETLVAFLDYLRERVLEKLADVDDDRARQQSVSSGTSLYWLGTHMAAVEINQFQRVLDGRDENRLVPPPPPQDNDPMPDVLARYRAACGESRRILSTFDDLGEMGRGVDRRTGDRRTVRWVLTHMIEETARHAGHIDILREQLDGLTGR
jgi:uncharacterized damage-inducible protein DinB